MRTFFMAALLLFWQPAMASDLTQASIGASEVSFVSIETDVPCSNGLTYEDGVDVFFEAVSEGTSSYSIEVFVVKNGVLKNKMFTVGADMAPMEIQCSPLENGMFNHVSMIKHTIKRLGNKK